MRARELPDDGYSVIPQWSTAGDCLVVGGLPVTRLAERIGATPFYAYDRRRIEERIDLVRRHLPDGVDLHYAMKANPMPAVVDHVARLVDGLDVASSGELKVALDSGIDSGEVSFAGPGKQIGELRQAVAAGVLVNVESTREIGALAAISRELALPARVGIRINPDFELKSSGMKMGGGAKQFGIDAEQVPDLLRDVARLGLTFEGFHIFGGSQNLRAPSICEAQNRSFELALQLAERAPVLPRLINIGGGFGIPYFPGERPLDLEAIGANLDTLARRAQDELRGARLVLELGRYLVGESGVYVCRVIDRKVSRGQVFLVTDGGLHHHLAASGNFGQVLRKNYPVVIGNRILSQKREITTITGPLCTPLDVIAERIDLPCADVGDLVVVFQSGAYGYTASPHRFLSHPPPVEALV